MQGNWLKIEDYAAAVNLSMNTIETMIANNELVTKEEDSILYIDANSQTKTIIPQALNEIATTVGSEMMVQQQFVEKTISTIINLHEKVLVSKDETISVMADENSFLKEAVYQTQELYNEDRKTVEALTEQLKLSQDEVSYMRRKYKLMWGKVVEDYAAPREKLPA